MKKIYKTLCTILGLISILMGMTLICGCGQNTSSISKSGFYFDTIIKITLYDSSKETLLDDCFALADTYEKMFSTTVKDSDISRINAANGTATEVSAETIELLELGIYYSTLSEGCFDITIGALSSLWDFSSTAGSIPAQTDIQAALSTVDYTGIGIEGNLVTLKNPNTKLDLGGIAKGYIADKMKAFLNANAVTEGIINLGGNVLCLGEKTDRQPYKIGIQKPFDTSGSALAVLEISDQTVVSSGVYERYFKQEDTLYHHILNPKTGYPYETDLLGVTIIGTASADADALSTVCFSLGLKKGMELIESLPNIEAVFISEGNCLHTSSGIGSKIPFYTYD